MIREEEEEVRIRKETEKLLTIIEEAKKPKKRTKSLVYKFFFNR